MFPINTHFQLVSQCLPEALMMQVTIYGAPQERIVVLLFLQIELPDLQCQHVHSTVDGWDFEGLPVLQICRKKKMSICMRMCDFLSCNFMSFIIFLSGFVHKPKSLQSCFRSSQTTRRCILDCIILNFDLPLPFLILTSLLRANLTELGFSFESKLPIHFEKETCEFSNAFEFGKSLRIDYHIIYLLP